jgi:hypothetical protein
MKKPILPPAELFTPEEALFEVECSETAFAILRSFGMEYLKPLDKLLLRMRVTDRVDGADSVEEDADFVAVRLRSAPLLPIFELELNMESVYERDFGVAIVESGTMPSEDATDERVDEDFSWEPKVAIITNHRNLEDVFICDAKTGRELDDAEKTDLLFLLRSVQQNLQKEVNDDSVSLVTEDSRVGEIGIRDSMHFDPFDGEFINGYECSNCMAGYTVCEHNAHKLN